METRDTGVAKRIPRKRELKVILLEEPVFWKVRVAKRIPRKRELKGMERQARTSINSCRKANPEEKGTESY